MQEKMMNIFPIYPETWNELVNWMNYRKNSGEIINEDSWLMRDLWDTRVAQGRGLITRPKKGNVRQDKLAIGVPYQDKTNIGRWRSSVEDKRDRGNVWFIPYPTIQASRPHPAVFPEKLPLRCIKLHGVKPDMIVYDPFMGIGTTALACISLGVNYLGTEIDSEYVKVAVENIEKRKNSGAIDDWLEEEKKENEILFK